MSDQEMLNAIRQIVEETFDAKVAPIAKDIEAIKAAILEIDSQINIMKSDIRDLKNVTAQNAYEISLLKTRIA